MITVKVIYKDGTTDIKDCFDVQDVWVFGVIDVIILRTKAA